MKKGKSKARHGAGPSAASSSEMDELAQMMAMMMGVGGMGGMPGTMDPAAMFGGMPDDDIPPTTGKGQRRVNGRGGTGKGGKAATRGKGGKPSSRRQQQQQPGADGMEDELAMMMAAMMGGDMAAAMMGKGKGNPGGKKARGSSRYRDDDSDDDDEDDDLSPVLNMLPKDVRDTLLAQYGPDELPGVLEELLSQGGLGALGEMGLEDMLAMGLLGMGMDPEAEAEEFLESLPMTIRARVYALQNLHEQQRQLENEKQTDLLLAKLRKENRLLRLQRERDVHTAGIPCFWLRVLQNGGAKKGLVDWVTKGDERVLRHLTNITCFTYPNYVRKMKQLGREDQLQREVAAGDIVLDERVDEFCEGAAGSGVVVWFDMEPNEYIENATLEKRWETGNVHSEDRRGDTVVLTSVGTEVQWKGRRALKDLGDSFFTFFETVNPTTTQTLSASHAEVLEIDFMVAELLRNSITPNAAALYLADPTTAPDGDDGWVTDDGKPQGKKSKSKGKKKKTKGKKK